MLFSHDPNAKEDPFEKMSGQALSPLIPKTEESRRIIVRGAQGGILFIFDNAKKQIEIKRGSALYAVPIWKIEEFARTSQRDTYQVYDENAIVPAVQEDDGLEGT